MSSYNPALEWAFCSFWCHLLVGSLLKHNFPSLYNRIVGTISSYPIVVYTRTCFCSVNCTPLPASIREDVDLDRCPVFPVSSFVLLSLMQFYRVFRCMVRNLIAVWIWIGFCIVSYDHFPVGHFMDVDLNGCLLLVISVVPQALARVSRGPPAVSVGKFLQYNAVASMKVFIFRGMQFGSVLILPEQLGRCGVITVVSNGIALGLQLCQLVLQWSFANPKLGTVCVPRPLTHFEVPIVAGHNIAGRESGNFRCPAFLLHGTGFSQMGRRLFLSASRNLGITLQSEVRNLRQTFHKFSSAAISGVFTFYSRVDKVLHHAPGLGSFASTYNRGCDGSPTYRIGPCYSSSRCSWQMEQTWNLIQGAVEMITLLP